MIITGTGAVESAGVTTAIWMSTVMEGYVVLSTWPTSCRPTTGYLPISPFVELTTDQATLGTLRGTRPITSRSNASTICGRRSFHHVSAVVTFFPFSSVNT